MTAADARGTLFGLGIGPGDPELITVKAQRILARAPVIAYPAPQGGESLVRAIADPFVPPGRIEVVIETPMCAERYPAQDVYDRYAAILADHLAAGRDVALLCEGDPFLYGSFMYLFERLKDQFAVAVVPGVSSLAAASAVAGLPLVSRDEVLTVLPATLPAAELAGRLARGDAIAILKVGRHLGRVREVLAAAGRLDGALYVERATMADQRLAPLVAVGDAAAPYFSIVLVPAVRAARRPAAVPEGVAILALSPAGARLAGLLKRHLAGATRFGLAGRVDADAVDETFTDTVGQLRALFRRGVPIVGVCAAGILIRALAPLLTDKRGEPPVLAVAEDGSVIVPLLGGHAGANALAQAMAAATGGVAAITTAGDVAFGLALDAPPAGWHVANPEAAKAVMADLLAGRPVKLTQEVGDGGWLSASGAPFAADGERTILITCRRVEAGPAAPLILHPPVLAVGVGCARDCPAEELIALARDTLAAGGLAEGAVAAVVSHELKADEPAVHALAAALGVPARFFPAARLEAETPRLANPSPLVFAEVGCHGVAEAAALAAAGEGGVLVIAKTKTPRATCAVARAPQPIDAGAVGVPRGELAIVGIGPGAVGWRTPEATRALTRATDVVGYQLYLDLLEDVLGDQRLHAPPMTEEEARARLALDLAAGGRRVCLVSSGDAGIYGLATLVYELLEREDRDAWNRVALSVLPGVSALQAAAARAGAPLGHDFCAISLSDLLTPWADIERRLQAAAEGDFVVALYNPVSRRRRTQVEQARDILLAFRPTTTPVILARNLGRPGETMQIRTLGHLAADDADMLTIIIVGSSRSRFCRRGRHSFVYTPRGYAGKVPP